MSGDAKRFRALHGSAGRHGATFWEEEKNNIGMRLLKGMGWETGQGLGKHGNGRVEAVKQFKKKDNAGIGSTAGTRDEAFRASQDLFNDVLARLSGGGASAAPEEATSDGQNALGSAAKTIQGSMARRQMVRRFCRAEGGGKTAAGAMEEVLGRKKGASGADDSAATDAQEAVGEPDNQQTSTVSISDYFAKRRQALGLSALASSVATSGGSSGGGFTLDDQADFAMEQMVSAHSPAHI